LIFRTFENPIFGIFLIFSLFRSSFMFLLRYTESSIIEEDKNFYGISNVYSLNFIVDFLSRYTRFVTTSSRLIKLLFMSFPIHVTRTK